MAIAWTVALIAIAPAPFTLHPSVRALRAPPRLCVGGSDGPAAESKPPAPVAPLTTIAEMVETSFVRACLDLSSGLVDTLKLFIAATKAAYEQRAPASELLGALGACERQTANRPLMPEEEELRALWVQLVYLALEALEHPAAAATVASSASPSVPAAARAEHAPFVAAVIDARAAGQPLATLDAAALGGGGGGGDGDAMAAAVRFQSARLVYLTASVLREEAVATGTAPPGPTIPGVEL